MPKGSERYIDHRRRGRARRLWCGPRQIRGEAHYRARLCEESVITARWLSEIGYTYTLIARYYDVTIACIRRACTGETWAHVGGPLQGPKTRRGLPV